MKSPSEATFLLTNTHSEDLEDATILPDLSISDSGTFLSNPSSFYSDDDSFYPRFHKRKPGWQLRRFWFWFTIINAIFYVGLLLVLISFAGLASSSQYPGVIQYERFINMMFGLAQTILFFWLYGISCWVFLRYRIDYISTLDLSEDHPEDAPISHVLTLKPGCCEYGPHDYKRVFHLISPVSLFLCICFVCMLIIFAVDRSDPDWPSGLFPVLGFTLFILYLIVPYLPPLPLTRISFTKVLLKSLCAIIYPFFGFDFAQLIVADCLTSASLTLYQLELVGCFMFTGEFSRDSYVNACGTGSNKLIGQPIMYTFPYWIRFVQCLYMYFQTRSYGIRSWKNHGNLINAGKYMSGILAVLSSFVAQDLDQHGTQFWNVFYISMTAIKTIYCIMWDTYVDFDLGKIPQRREFPFFLRPERSYPSILFYYWVIISNAIMRCMWAVALTTSVPYNWGMLMAIVEIFRRSQWVLLRVEVEKFRRSAEE